MSVKLLSRVFEMRGLPQQYKIVLLRMADHANTDGWCYPGQRSLAADCETSERSIQRALALLDRLGLVEKLKRHRRSPQEYQLHLPEPVLDVHWFTHVEAATENPDLRLPHGWFDQDPTPAAGLGEGHSSGADLVPDPTPVSALPGGLDPTQDPTQDLTPLAPRPDTHGGSLKGTVRGTSRTARAAETRPPSISESAIRQRAAQRAAEKGARNLGALTEKIYSEDRDELLAEMLEEQKTIIAIEEINACLVCDNNGFAWYSNAGQAVGHADPDADSAVRCSHDPGRDAAAQKPDMSPADEHHGGSHISLRPSPNLETVAP